VTALNGEADQGAASVQVSVRRRDGKTCRSVTSARTARLAKATRCSPTATRWLPARATLRKGRTQTWTLRFGAHLPAGRYTATVRALDLEQRAGRTRSVTFRVR
jgi:predicted phage tail protein